MHAGTLVGLLAVRVPEDEPLAAARQQTLAAMAELAATALHAAQLDAGLADDRERRARAVAVERKAVADVLRLELLTELETLAGRLEKLEGRDPDEPAASIERSYLACAAMIRPRALAQPRARRT